MTNQAARADIPGLGNPAIPQAEARALVWNSRKHEEEFLCTVLQEHEMFPHACFGLNELCGELESGAALAVIECHLLDHHAWERIEHALVQQPSWADLQIVILGDQNEFDGRGAWMQRLDANVLLLERPLKTATLFSVLRAAGHARKRQEDLRLLLSKSARRQEAMQAKEDLVRERHFSDLAINSLPGLFYALDEHGGFLRWNKALEQVGGYSTEEVARMHALQFFAPEHQGLIAERIGDVFRDGHATADAPLLTKAGAQIPFFFTGKRCFVDGRPILVGMGMDATEHKRTEAELRETRNRLSRHAEELERRVAERTRNLQASIQSLEGVLYHVAHDLRAPLRTMQGFTTILLEESWGLHGDGVDYAQRIAQAASRMDKLIQDLLAYGRLAHMPLKPERVELGKLMENVLGQLAKQIQSRNAVVEVQGPLQDVYGDLAILNLLLCHLVTNAINFVSPDVTPHVCIHTEQLNPATIRLLVVDNGIGISPEHHERIFRVFERLEAGGVSNGTGIGLAIVKKGAERMGGAAGLESAIGAGSRFWLDLPAVQHITTY